MGDLRDLNNLVTHTKITQDTYVGYASRLGHKGHPDRKGHLENLDILSDTKSPKTCRLSKP